MDAALGCSNIKFRLSNKATNIWHWKKKILVQKKTLKKKFVSGTQCGGFQFIVILTP